MHNDPAPHRRRVARVLTVGVLVRSALHGVLRIRGLRLDILGRRGTLVLHGVHGVGRGRRDLCHRLLGGFLQIVGDLLGRVRQLRHHRFGCLLDLLRGTLLSATRGEQRGHQHPSAERDEAGGNRTALGPSGHCARRAGRRVTDGSGRTAGGVGDLRGRPQNRLFDGNRRAAHPVPLTAGDAGGVHLLTQRVDVVTQVRPGPLDLAADLFWIITHALPSFPFKASGIFCTVEAVRGSPRTARNSLRPTRAKIAPMTAQITATINADQPKPVAAPIAHHNARDANKTTKYPATAAPDSIPTPLPARLADCWTSGTHLSTSWRSNVDRSWVTSEIRSPNDRSATDDGSAARLLVSVGVLIAADPGSRRSLSHCLPWSRNRSPALADNGPGRAESR